MYYNSIEDVEFEIDLAGKGPIGFLKLYGDFEDAFKHYLNNDDATSVVFQIDRRAAGKLVDLLFSYAKYDV